MISKKIAISLILLITCASCSLGGGNKAPTPPADWMRVATIGGLQVTSGLSDGEILVLLNDLVKQNVTVVEADGSLSEYLTDEEFDEELTLMRRMADLAAQKNLKVVWYYPSLESITLDGETSSSTMFKDHPDWVQRNIDGSPNVFYGSQAFWVPPGAESAWLAPLTGYREYYLDRIRKIAATGIDGVWVDVPLYNYIVGVWPSYTPEDIAQFKADTGYDIPMAADPNDPVWWIFIQWRHEIVDEFLKDVLAAARSVNPDFYIVVETVTLDCNEALRQALDGSFTGPLDGFWHVWEVSIVSISTSMVYAKADDWISMIAMYMFGRNADRGRSSWAFTYGYEPDDAELVMAEALATQNNPYELKVPQMTTTVGAEYRRMMFGWIREYEDELFRSDSMAKIAILHSSASRDYVDGLCIMAGDCGTALYATWDAPTDPDDWWTNDENDSIYSANYMAEYKGFVKALVHMHQPFDVLPSRLATSEILSNYDLVLLPDYRAVSDEEAALIKSYVSGGGNAFFTGPAPGTRTEVAADRGGTVFADLLDPNTPDEQCSEMAHGDGRSTYCNYQVAKRYFDVNGATVFAKISEIVTGYAPTLIETDAPDNVHMTMYSTSDQLVLNIVNFVGVDGDLSVEPQTFNVTLDISELPDASFVFATSPGLTEAISIPFTTNGTQLSFEITVDKYTMVIIL